MNNLHSLLFIDPPQLSDETVGEIFDFLHELLIAFENHYANQLRRYQQPSEPPEPEVFEDFDDEIPF